MSGRYRRALALSLFVVLAASLAMAEVYAKIPAGTAVQVRIIDSLSSETAKVGQQFHGTLSAPVVANGKVLFPKGAQVTGEVVNVERSGRLSTPGELHLTLRTIRNGGRNYAVSVPAIVIKGESHTKSNVTKIGGGTAVGAIIGALAGGGKGAAIGAGVGAAAGTGAAAATGKKPAQVESEAVLEWQTQGASPAPQYQDQRQARDDRSRDDRYSDDRYEAQERPEPPSYQQAPVYDDRGPGGFSSRERQMISDCYVDQRSGLPPGLAKKDRLPPGLERHLQKNGTLPPGLQKRVQPLPYQCEAGLPRLPRNWSRVVLGGRILLLDSRQTIIDLFWVQGN